MIIVAKKKALSQCTFTYIIIMSYSVIKGSSEKAGILKFYCDNAQLPFCLVLHSPSPLWIHMRPCTYAL